MPTGPELERVVKVGVEDADTGHRARFAASRRAATAVRNLIEVLHRSALSDDDYNRVAEGVDVIVARLAPLPPASRYDESDPVDLAVAAVGATSGGLVTRELNISYRRPVPTLAPLQVLARVESIDGRRISVSSKILSDNETLVEGHRVMSSPLPSAGTERS